MREHERAWYARSMTVRRFVCSCAAVISIGLTSITPAFAAGTAPLPIRVALDARALAGRVPIAVSADGMHVAYTLQRSGVKEPMAPNSLHYSTTGVMTEAFGTDIWVADASGKPQNLTGGAGANSGPAWSPDGSMLAFLSDRDGANRLWIWDRASGKLRRASDAIAFAFFTFEVPRWLPDGKHVVVKILPEGKSLAETIALSTSPVLTKSSGGTAPKVYVYDPASKPAAQAAGATFGASTWLGREVGDLGIVDVTTGAVERIARSVRPLAWPISPDGTKIVYSTLDGMDTETSQQVVGDLIVYDLTTKTSRVLVAKTTINYGLSMTWSPDGKRIAFSTAGTDDISATKKDEHTRGDVLVIALDGTQARNLTPGEHPSFTEDQHGPTWLGPDTLLAFAGDTLYRIGAETPGAVPIAKLPGRIIRGIVGPPLTGRTWNGDPGAVDVLVRDASTKREGVARVTVASGAVKTLFDGPLRIADPTMGVSGAAGRVYFVAQDAQYGEQLFVATDGMSKRTLIGRFNEQLTQYALGVSTVIDYTTSDGQQLHGALLLPGNYQPGHRYPLVVRVYGGELESDSVNRFGIEGAGPDNMQILASRGYAVLEPDTPLREGQPLSDLALTVMPAIDTTIALGIADPDRIAVEGHSYGGYSTLALIVQSTRFKAAIDSAGVADLVSGYGEFTDGDSTGIGWSEEGQGRMRTTPWQNLKRYIDNSPYYRLDKVETPLLIVHGDADSAVPIAQTDEVFVALRRLKKPVEYVVYPGEDHWQGTWTLDHVLDYWDRSLAFLADHLHP